MTLYIVIVIVVSASWVGWGACGIAVSVRGRISIIRCPLCGWSGTGGNGMVDRSLGTGAVSGVCGNCMVIGDPGGDILCDLWDVCGMAILGGWCGGIAGGPRGGGGGRVICSVVIMGTGRGVIGGGGGSCMGIGCSGGSDLVAA